MMDFDTLVGELVDQHSKRQYMNALSVLGDLYKLLLKEFYHVLHNTAEKQSRTVMVELNGPWAKDGPRVTVEE